MTAERRADRRRAPRTSSAAQHGVVCVRIRPGREVTLLDVSAAGALLQCAHRLLPGTAIELQLTTAGRRVTTRGLVVRCSVSQVWPSAIWYRGAVMFEQPLPWILAADDQDGYRLHAAETADEPLRWAAATHPDSRHP
jgi:hypothetical protein